MRFWNSRETALNEALNGIKRACPGKYTRLETEYGYGLYRNNISSNRVRIIVDGGGGYGHMWSAFAEEGLADAMVHGNFDSAPNAYVLYEMAKNIDCGKGILFLTNHYMGDYVNNDMAVELLAHDNINAAMCCISDDILSCEGEIAENRGGLHGIGQVCKICAGAAREGYNLEQLSKLASKSNSRVRSVSLNVREGKLFFGEGFSGEPAVKEKVFESVDQMFSDAVDILLSELGLWKDCPMYLSVNNHCNVGFTESMVLLESAAKQIEERKIKLCGCAAGTYFDVFDGKGCILSLIACDEEMQKYIAPVNGYGYVI